ncbi:MAG: hypothetical protein AAEJ47_07210 [Planctomycetota bacterium]
MRVSFLMLLGGLLLLASSGCDNHCSGSCFNDPIVSSSSFDFIYEGDLSDFTSSESYYWETDLLDAFVSFEGIGFYGSVRVRIYDMFNFLIFDETFFGNGGTLRAKLISDFGFSGLWEVQIDSSHVDGFVSIILD